MTLEQIKNEVAKEFGYDDEKHFYDCAPIDKCVEYVNEVCKRYATDCVKASLEKASRYVNVIYTGDPIQHAEADRKSITREDNIVLL